MASQEQIYAMSQPAPRPVLPDYFASRSRSRDRDNDDQEVTASTSGIHYETITKRQKKTHTVRRGETLTEIADRYDMSTSEVKKLNRLRSSSVKRGQRLQVIALVKTKVAVKDPAPAVAVKKDTGNAQVAAVTVEKTDTAEQKLADQKADSSKEVQSVSITTQQDKRPKYVYHLVQPGDTLWNIAKRYDGVTVEMIKDINNLHNANIKPGTRLKVIVNG